jgi:hypothetical protein
MASLDEDRVWANVLYYGDPGTGKTTSMAGLARLGRMLFIDAESGLKAAPLRKQGIPTDQVVTHRGVSFTELDSVFWDLHDQLETDPDAIVGVALDSMTEIQKLLMEGILAKANRKDPFFVERSDWGINTEQMRKIIRRYRDLPCHVAFGALPKRDLDDDGAVRYMPALTPAVQTDLMGYMDVIIHTEVTRIAGETFYLGTTTSTGKYAGKDRFGALPGTLVNPSMDRVVGFIEGRLDPSKDPLQMLAQKAIEREKAE